MLVGANYILYFVIQRFGDSPKHKCFNHYQPSVLSTHSLEAQCFIFTGIKTCLFISCISMNILKMVSDINPSLATISNSHFIFHERRNQKLCKKYLRKACVHSGDVFLCLPTILLPERSWNLMCWWCSLPFFVVTGVAFEALRQHIKHPVA